MSSFVPRAIPPTLAGPDPTKHVKYTLGMVLGVDDFTQEFAYLAGRDRWLARDLLGYGTASGLRVGVEIENRSPQVVVTPGAAVSPSGQLIRVAPAQCADLNLWLAARHEELRQRLGAAPSNRALLRLYLVLCYRDCATDMAPIPGEPCRSQDETMAPSRLADDFKLELRYEAPDQREEDALRDFVEWLGQVEVTDEPGSYSTLEELEKAIRDAARAPSSPPSPPDFFYGSPPEALRIHPSMAYEYLRAAFRLWTTELRPSWHDARGDRGEVLPSSAAAAGDEDCVLLAEVSVPLARNTANTIWQVEDATRVEIHEERRPYLVHLRMLQELVVSGRRAGGGATSGGASIGPAFGVVAETSYGLQPNAGKRFDYARADHTHGTPPAPALAGDVTGPVDSTTVASIRNREVLATAPAEGQVLTFTGGKWQPAAPTGGTGTALKPATTITAETNFSQTSAVGASVDYARADHTHGTPPPPTLAGDVTGAVGATKVAAIQNVAVDATKPTTTGQLLGFDATLNRWKPVPPPVATTPNLAGDVTGATGSTKVIAIQNTTVDATKPTTGQFLGFDAPTNSWKPLAPPSGGGTTTTNAVTRSTTLAYAVVAAGILPGVVGGPGNSYNNLRVTSVKNGQITMLFDGYRQPPAASPTQQYIVKVMGVLPPNTGLFDLMIAFAGFGDDATGFTLFVNNVGSPLNAIAINNMSFMVEVSQFEIRNLGLSKAIEGKTTKEKDDKAIKDTEAKTIDSESKFTDAPSASPASASLSSFAPAAEAKDGEAAPDGRAFIAEEERPEVGRAAFDLADKQDDKLPEAGAAGKQAEAFN
jgi:hypothetical protein